MFGRPGLLAVFVLVGVGLAAGADVLGVVVVLPVAGAAFVAGDVPEVWPAPEVVPVPDAGVVGVEAGSDVNGVGSGGNGFESTAAIISFKPSAD